MHITRFWNHLPDSFQEMKGKAEISEGKGRGRNAYAQTFILSDA